MDPVLVGNLFKMRDDGLFWIRFGQGNAVTAIIFSQSSEIPFFREPFKHFKALLRHCEIDFKSLSGTGPLKAPIIGLTSGNLFDEFISVHP
jgi:hypothetical protein